MKIPDFEFEVIPIEESDSMLDQGEMADICFSVDEYGMVDGPYFGIKGDGWDRYGNPDVPDWCNYCIQLPWKKINEVINQFVKDKYFGGE